MSAPSGTVEAFRMEPSLSGYGVARATGSGRSYYDPYLERVALTLVADPIEEPDTCMFF